MKPYRAEDLSRIFDSEMSWRRRELSDLKSAVKSADSAAQAAFLRALVTMIYAHWEGYVRECANRYFQHLTLRKRPYSEFARQFYVNAFLARLDALWQTRFSISDRCKLINDILDGGAGRFSFINDELVDTRSNLNTDVIKDICMICDVDHSHFESKRTFIDMIILKRRNAIAHGQQEPVLVGEVDDLVSNGLALMEHFRTLLENKIYTKGFEAV